MRTAWPGLPASAMVVSLLAGSVDARQAEMPTHAISTLMSCVTITDFGVVNTLGVEPHRDGYLYLMRNIYRRSDLTVNDLQAAVDRGVSSAARLTENLASTNTMARREAEAAIARIVAECNVVALNNGR